RHPRPNAMVSKTTVSSKALRALNAHCLQNGFREGLEASNYTSRLLTMLPFLGAFDKFPLGVLARAFLSGRNWFGIGTLNEFALHIATRPLLYRGSRFGIRAFDKFTFCISACIGCEHRGGKQSCDGKN